MADWELLVAPDFEGDVAHYTEDDGAGGFHVHSVQNVEPIIEANKAARNHNDGYTSDRTLRRVASIPLWVRLHFINTEGWDPWQPARYPERMARLLNDGDWAFLRTADGRVAVTNGVIR